MPADSGNQNISLKYGVAGNSTEINRRQVNIEPTGIYKGGYLSVVDNTHASISPLVCSVASGLNQIRVETTTSVNLLVGSGAPYIVLRWTYTGAVDDYMELLAVASGSILSGDLIIGKCSFSGGGNLIGFDYDNASYPRSHPNVQDLNLKVLPPITTELRMWVNPGKVQVGSQTFSVPLQQTDAITPPVSDSKIYLVYVNTTDGTIKIDTSGTAAATPVAPAYNGKLVLAEVTLASTATTITASNIKDKRMFVSPRPVEVDDSTIELSSAGLIKRVDPYYLVTKTYGSQLSDQVNWTPITDLGTTVKQSGISRDVPTGHITLPAGRLYRISYTVQFRRTTGSPEFYSRLKTVSGDLSWEFNDDDFNVSLQSTETGNILEAFCTHSGTYIILPASTTVIRLEVKTRDSHGHYGSVVGANLSVWSN